MKYEKPKIVMHYLDRYQYSSEKGKDIDEFNAINKTIQSHGYEVLPIKTRWPRDAYVHDGTNLITQFEQGNLGVGGLIVESDDFVIFSSVVKDMFHCDPKKAIKRKNMFKDKKIYFVEPMVNKNGTYIDQNMHIDTTIGSIPSLNLLTVDEDHYKQRKTLFNKISRENYTEIIPIKINQENKRSWHNNYLVIENGETLVITDGYADNVNKVLQNLNINLSPIDIGMIANPKLGGSIRCLTNIVKNEETEIFINDLEKVEEKVIHVFIATGVKPNLEQVLNIVRNERLNNFNNSSN